MEIKDEKDMDGFFVDAGLGGVYRFHRKGVEAPVTKSAYWQTVALHGAAWRLAISCAMDGIEK